jgi:hypothetical protein
MEPLHRLQPWDRQTLRLSLFVVEMARVFKKRVQVELFAPPRQCSHCKRGSKVFVRPMNVCASCWSYDTLSKTAAALKKLAAAA